MTACLAPGCDKETGSWPPCCRTHWDVLPEHIKAQLRRNTPAPGMPAGPSYAAIRLTAVSWFAEVDQQQRTKADDQAALTRRITGERDE